MTEDIFEYHNSIINNHPKDKYQAKEGETVDGKAKNLHQYECKEKGNRDADRGKEGVSQTHGDPQNEKH